MLTSCSISPNRIPLWSVKSGPPTHCRTVDRRDHQQSAQPYIGQPGVRSVEWTGNSAASGMRGPQPETAFWGPNRQARVGPSDPALVKDCHWNQLGMETAHRVQFGQRNAAIGPDLQRKWVPAGGPSLQRSGGHLGEVSPKGTPVVKRPPPANLA